MPLVSYSFSQLIDYTRTTAATYVNSSGLVTVTPASVNLLTYTQEFDNAAWTKTNATASANSIAAPDGTVTADTLTATAGNATALQAYTASAVQYTFSIYLRRLTGTGAVELTVDGTTYTAVTITSQWARYQVTLTPAAGARSAGVRVVTSGDAVYAWGAQLEAAATASTYTRNFGGLYPPRFDYDPVTLQPKGFIMEAQRTNLFLRSEEFDNAFWTKNAATVTANATTSPDGTIDADKLIPNTTNNVHGAYSTATYGAGTFTLSVYAKAAGYPRLGIRSYDGTSYVMQATFDISNGTVVSSPGGTATITSVGNSWYRITLTATAAGNLGSVVGTWFESLPAGATVQTAFTGDGTSGAFLWGAQLEVGSYASSYIPTAASQVTRTADSGSITGGNFSQWFNGSEGSIVVEGQFFVGATANTGTFSLNSGNLAANNLINVGVSSLSTNTRSFIYDGATTTFDAIITGGGATGNIVKQAMAYKSNDSVACANGTLSPVDGSVSIPTGLNQATIGQGGASNQLVPGWYRVIKYYPSRLTNVQLQTLTT